jgi:hypothetical protein
MIEVLDIWHGFWSTATVVAGTLLGLLFVAAAIRAKECFSDKQRPAQTLWYQAVMAYAALAMIGLLVLMPMLSQRRMGLAIAGLGGLLVLISSWRVITSQRDRSGFFGVIPGTPGELVAWLSYVMIAWAGIKLMRGVVHAFDWVAVAGWLLLASALSMSIQFLRKSAA